MILIDKKIKQLKNKKEAILIQQRFFYFEITRSLEIQKIIRMRVKVEWEEVEGNTIHDVI